MVLTVVREYVEALGLTFAVLVDPRGEIQRRRARASGYLRLPAVSPPTR